MLDVDLRVEVRDMHGSNLFMYYITPQYITLSRALSCTWGTVGTLWGLETILYSPGRRPGTAVPAGGRGLAGTGTTVPGQKPGLGGTGD